MLWSRLQVNPAVSTTLCSLAVKRQARRPRPAAYAGRMPETPFDQSTYQVRLEWGVDGFARLAPADIVVVVDVLRFSTTVIDAVARGEDYPADAAHAVSLNGIAVAEAAARTGALVLLGALRNASAVAGAVLAEQERRGARTSIAVIAAGELTGRDAGATVRFAVEDQLGAGAIIDALGSLGIDHTSPDAAVASESFRALRRAVMHLLTASGSGRELIARGQRDDVLAAAAVDAASVVPVLRDGVFRAF
jgi:2-phosphosulfolactate phosphatase